MTTLVHIKEKSVSKFKCFSDCFNIANILWNKMMHILLIAILISLCQYTFYLYIKILKCIDLTMSELLDDESIGTNILLNLNAILFQ